MKSKLAKAQIAAGAVGIACRKIGDVEALLVEAPEIAEVLLTYPVPGASKLAGLARRVRLTISAPYATQPPVSHALG